MKKLLLAFALIVGCIFSTTSITYAEMPADWTIGTEEPNDLSSSVESSNDTGTSNIPKEYTIGTEEFDYSLDELDEGSYEGSLLHQREEFYKEFERRQRFHNLLSSLFPIFMVLYIAFHIKTRGRYLFCGRRWWAKQILRKLFG